MQAGRPRRHRDDLMTALRPLRGQTVAEASAVARHLPGLGAHQRRHQVPRRGVVVAPRDHLATDAVAHRAREVRVVARRGPARDDELRRGLAVELVEGDQLVPGRAGLLHDRHMPVVVRARDQAMPRGRRRETEDHDRQQGRDREDPAVDGDLEQGYTSFVELELIGLSRQGRGRSIEGRRFTVDTIVLGEDVPPFRLVAG